MYLLIRSLQIVTEYGVLYKLLVSVSCACVICEESAWINFVCVETSLMSTKNPDIAKCSLIDFIKGSKSMQFFAK